MRLLGACPIQADSTAYAARALVHGGQCRGHAARHRHGAGTWGRAELLAPLASPLHEFALGLDARTGDGVVVWQQVLTKTDQGGIAGWQIVVRRFD